MRRDFFNSAVIANSKMDYYKFKKIMLKNIYIHRLSDCLAVKVKILDGMKKNFVCLGKQERWEINEKFYLVMKFPGSLIQFFIVNKAIS